MTARGATLMQRPLYRIKITLEDEENTAEVAEALNTALCGYEGPALARAVTSDPESNAVVVDFEAVEADRIAPHPEALEPDAHEALDHVSRLRSEPTALLAIVRALIAASDAREKAGLEPRTRLTIDVSPTSPPRADWSEDVK
jgi:hypothetical protein